MSDTQITHEDAQKLLEENFASIAKNEAPTPEPTAPEPAEPVVTAPAPEPAPAEPPTTPDPAHHEPAREEPAKPTADDPYAWVESLPEEARDKVIQEIQAKLTYEHQFRSNNGRIRTLQQKLLEAQKAISENRTATKPSPADRQPPSTPEGWQELMKNEPDLAAAIEARVKSEIESAVGSVKSELQEFKKHAVDPLHEQQREQYVEHQRNELKSLVPNYEQVVSDPNYQRWLETVAAPGLRYLATNSVEAKDAFTVLRQYADDMTRMGVFKPPTAPEPTAPPPTPQNDAADKLAAARAAKLNSPTPTTQVPVAPVAPVSKTDITKDDAQAMLEKIWGELNPKR